MGRKLVLTVVGLIALGIWAASILAGLTGGTYARFSGAGLDVKDRGVARNVGDCTREGPVSAYGFGYWWTCRADVEWDSGSSGRMAAEAGELSPEDKGDVLVVRRDLPGAGRGNPSVPTLFRADSEPSTVLGLGSMFAGLGVGGIAALGIFVTTASRTKKAA